MLSKSKTVLLRGFLVIKGDHKNLDLVSLHTYLPMATKEFGVYRGRYRRPILAQVCMVAACPCAVAVVSTLLKLMLLTIYLGFDEVRHSIYRRVTHITFSSYNYF